ncbi:SDR family NAD(P)-dependent oxidoreductase [Niabella sp. CC-SYL272]|uniref:SDR family NAD(P)-dependent oxidoreductase n=1 Tax=Niabella agricola TaxID=2891571 RepID=UPI001F22E02B|nr:SDR family NAD(P)-dependent oxidoreductase [Niabella agricola]MCF3107598.1 SDR family NAD(P)-dependent oxidoreductase [Niabella agricola]
MERVFIKPRSLVSPYLLLMLAFVQWLATGCTTHRLSRSKQKRIDQQVWVITGASSGLGRGIALEAGRCKARVVLAARNREALEAVATEIRRYGGEAWVAPTDVSDTMAVQLLRSGTVARWKKIDVWVNNAGVTAMGSLWEVPLKDQSRVIDVNLKDTLYGSYEAIRQFRQQGYGQLINIVSAESRLPTPYQTGYVAAKAGIKNMGIALRQELRLAGMKAIRIVSVDPWALNTPIWDHAASYSGRAPRMGFMDRTSKAVNAVLHAAASSKNRDIAVGWKTQAAYFFHHLFPTLAYRISANIVYKYQVKKAPSMEPSSGNLYQSIPPRQVETDIRQRMKREKAQKRSGVR